MSQILPKSETQNENRAILLNCSGAAVSTVVGTVLKIKVQPIFGPTTNIFWYIFIRNRTRKYEKKVWNVLTRVSRVFSALIGPTPPKKAWTNIKTPLFIVLGQNKCHIWVGNCTLTKFLFFKLKKVEKNICVTPYSYQNPSKVELKIGCYTICFLSTFFKLQKTYFTYPICSKFQVKLNSNRVFQK